jgi:hypothetical protein
MIYLNFCKRLIIGIIITLLFSGSFVEAYEKITFPSVTSGGSIVEKPQFSSSRYIEGYDSDLEKLESTDIIPRGNTAITFINTNGEIVSAGGSNSNSYSQSRVMSAINVIPGTSASTAIDLRDLHVRATFSQADTFHYYFVDVLPSEVATGTKIPFAVILANFPANADFDLYLFDEEGNQYFSYTDGLGAVEEYAFYMPHAGRYYVIVNSYIGTGIYDLYAGKYEQTATITLTQNYSVYVGSNNSTGSYAYSEWTPLNFSNLGYNYVPKDAMLLDHLSIRFTDTVNTTYMTFGRQIRRNDEPISDVGWGWAITTGGGPNSGEVLTPPIPLDSAKTYSVRNLWQTRARLRWGTNLTWTICKVKMDVRFPACADNFEYF